MRSVWLVVLVGCSSREAPPGGRPNADDVLGKLATFAPRCAPSVAGPSIECHGPSSTVTLRLDAQRRVRSLELREAASPEGRARLLAALSPLVSSDAVQHVDTGLDGFLLDFWPFGEISAASMHEPAVGDPRGFVAVVNWRG